MIRHAFLRGLASFLPAAILCGIILSAPAGAQTSTNIPAPRNISDADCEKIPGGNAPVNTLARIKGFMAVRNLEFTYFEKKLHQLTREDFNYLKRLIPYCGEQSPEQVTLIINRLAALVSEAQKTRLASIGWIRKTEAQLKDLPATKASIETVHNIWTELQNRALEMTRTDIGYLAGKINETRDRLYREAEIAAPEKLPALEISPFLPRIPEITRQPDPPDAAGPADPG